MAIGQLIRTQLDDFPKKNSIQVLDGVRALACLIVIMYHLSFVPHDFHIWDLRLSLPPLIASFLYFGRYGVTLFFVLSGFLLFLPFARALLFGQTWPSIRRFYLRRVFRILPAYYLSLILIVLLFQPQYLQPQHWRDLGLFFTFLMDSYQATFKQLNAPFWTLAIEWQYYMFLPLLVLGMRVIVWRIRPDHRLAATIACILTLIAWGVSTRYLGIYVMNLHPTATVLVPRPVLNGFLLVTYGMGGKYLEDFGVGMLLSLCFVYVQQSSISSRAHAVLLRLSPWVWAMGLLCLFAIILWNYNESYNNTWPLFSNGFLFANYYQLNELCFSLSFGLCILALLFGPAWLTLPFAWSPLRWIGLISYSLYMWHFPLLVVLMKWGQPLMTGWPLVLNYSAYWLWVLVVIIPFCFLFFLCIEKPGMKLGERFLDEHRGAESRGAIQRARGEGWMGQSEQEHQPLPSSAPPRAR